jgi:IS66 C-terminal element
VAVVLLQQHHQSRRREVRHARIADRRRSGIGWIAQAEVRADAPTAKRWSSDLLCAVNDRGRSLPSLKSGCASSEHCSPPRTIPPRRSTTFSTAGQRSPASSTTAASVLRTTPPNERWGVAVGRRNWTFAGSDAGGHRAAAVYTLIETCKMNDVDPQAWLADVLARLSDHPANKVADLLPWNWKANQQSKAAVAA